MFTLNQQPPNCAEFESRSDAWKHFLRYGWRDIAERYYSEKKDPRFLWLVREFAFKHAQIGNSTEMERTDVFSALKCSCTDEEILELVTMVIEKGTNHDSVIRIAQRFNLVTNELLLKHAKHSQDPVVRLLGMVLEKLASSV